MSKSKKEVKPTERQLQTALEIIQRSIAERHGGSPLLASLAEDADAEYQRAVKTLISSPAYLFRCVRAYAVMISEYQQIAGEMAATNDESVRVKMAQQLQRVNLEVYARPAAATTLTEHTVENKKAVSDWLKNKLKNNSDILATTASRSIEKEGWLKSFKGKSGRGGKTLG